jgi:hypothetical protein
MVNMKTFFLVLLAFVWLALRPAFAFDGAEPQSFTINTVRQAPPGCLPDTMIHITFGTNQFALRLLEGHRMFTDYAQHSLNLARVDSVCKLSFRILAGPDSGSYWDSSTYRQWIYNAHPGVQILNELTCYASGMKGPAFSFQWRRPDGLIESEQVAYIPCSAGILEFSATSIVTHADEAMTDLQQLLQAFRAPVNGKLVMPVRGNAS